MQATAGLHISKPSQQLREGQEAARKQISKFGLKSPNQVLQLSDSIDGTIRGYSFPSVSVLTVLGVIHGDLISA